MNRLLLLAVILSLAAALRFSSLSTLPSGLHWDEQDTGFQAWSLFSTGKDYFGNPLPLFLHSFADYRTPVFIYSAVPFVAVLKLTPLAVRLPSALFGLLSVLLMYFLGRQLFPHWQLKWGRFSLHAGHLSALFLAVSPWQVVYSRQSVECNAMLTFMLLGLVAFNRALTRSSWFWVSALSFGLAVASYSPAKFFIPLLGLALLWIHRDRLFDFSPKIFILPAVIFLAITLPIVGDGFWGASGTRFRDLSIFTDPTLSQLIDRQRQASALAQGRGEVGTTPTWLDRLTYNKLSQTLSQFATYYTDVYSPRYLFTQGDQELRHSPSLTSIGQLHLPDVLPTIFGLVLLTTGAYWGVKTKSASPLLLTWLLIGPIPSALTRGGGAHAARTFLLLPAFILIITAGVIHLARTSRLLFFTYLVALGLSCLSVFHYYFGTYRLESAAPFQWGFDQAVVLAQQTASRHGHVILDLHQDSAIMAYLFNSGITPAQFHAQQPLPATALTPDLSGVAFQNLLLLPPDTRFWTNIGSDSRLPADTWVIAKADQPLLDTQITPQQTVLYPDGTPFLYVFQLRP